MIMCITVQEVIIEYVLLMYSSLRFFDSSLYQIKASWYRISFFSTLRELNGDVNTTTQTSRAAKVRDIINCTVKSILTLRESTLYPSLIYYFFKTCLSEMQAINMELHYGVQLQMHMPNNKAQHSSSRLQMLLPISRMCDQTTHVGLPTLYRITVSISPQG